MERQGFKRTATIFNLISNVPFENNAVYTDKCWSTVRVRYNTFSVKSIAHIDLCADNLNHYQKCWPASLQHVNPAPTVLHHSPTPLLFKMVI